MELPDGTGPGGRPGRPKVLEVGSDPLAKRSAIWRSISVLGTVTPLSYGCHDAIWHRTATVDLPAAEQVVMADSTERRP